MSKKSEVLLFKKSGYVTVFWLVKSVAITIVHLLPRKDRPTTKHGRISSTNALHILIHDFFS